MELQTLIRYYPEKLYKCMGRRGRGRASGATTLDKWDFTMKPENTSPSTMHGVRSPISQPINTLPTPHVTFCRKHRQLRVRYPA